MVWSSDPSSWPAVEERPGQHWLIEKRLAETLLASSPEDREAVTRTVYNTLFDEVPWHVATAEDQEAFEEHWFQCYRPLTRPEDVLLDIGCGRGGLVKRFAAVLEEAIGLDASDAMVAIAQQVKPDNARFIVGNLLTPPLRAAGFTKVRGPAVPAKILVRLEFPQRRRAYMPVWFKSGLESLLRTVPVSVRPRVSGPMLVRDVTLVAERR